MIDEVWKDQEDFNLRFRARSSTFEGRSAQTKELLLHLHSECDELLRRCIWKFHRKTVITENLPAIKEELVDIFRYWASICQVWDIPFEEMMKAYWDKSLVTWQRLSEEFLDNNRKPIFVVDIDGVLCDYVKGFNDWMLSRGHSPKKLGSWLGKETYNLSTAEFQKLKHEFRVSGAKRHMPVIQGADEFLKTCRLRGFYILLLTSRPIQEYPNLHSDTLHWLRANGMAFDCLWWGENKGDVLHRKEVADRVAFAIDDDSIFIKQLKRTGVRTHLFKGNFTDVYRWMGELSDK